MLRRALEAQWGPLARWRDVAGDPGAPASPGRAPSDAPGLDGPRDVLAANLARAREAARSVEEALRAACPSLAPEAERIRYEVYALEGSLSRLLARPRQLEDVRLYVLLTTALASGPMLETARAALRGGAQMLQLREKEMPNREFLGLARALRDLTAESGTLLVINDRVEVAALTGADGAHQGQEDLPVAEARRILGPEALVGVSTHSEAEVRRAEAEGADYIGVGPLFATRTKEHRAAVGLEFVRTAARATRLPGFAIGGVNRSTLDRVLDAGATRVAACTGIIAEPDPERAARWFRERVDARWALRLGGLGPSGLEPSAQESSARK